jgi:hypothetical protein
MHSARGRLRLQDTCLKHYCFKVSCCYCCYRTSIKRCWPCHRRAQQTAKHGGRFVPCSCSGAGIQSLKGLPDHKLCAVTECVEFSGLMCGSFMNSVTN